MLTKTNNHVLMGMECQIVFGFLLTNLHLLKLIGAVSNYNKFLSVLFLHLLHFSLSHRLYPRKCKVLLDILRQRQ